MAAHVVVSEPETWLGATGWRRAGLIQVIEANLLSPDIS
jgi:hypothetical protein